MASEGNPGGVITDSAAGCITVCFFTGRAIRAGDRVAGPLRAPHGELSPSGTLAGGWL